MTVVRHNCDPKRYDRLTTAGQAALAGLALLVVLMLAACAEGGQDPTDPGGS